MDVTLGPVHRFFILNSCGTKKEDFVHAEEGGIKSNIIDLAQKLIVHDRKSVYLCGMKRDFHPW